MPRSKPPRRKPKPTAQAQQTHSLMQMMAKEKLVVPGGLMAYEKMTGKPMDQPTADAFMAGCAYIFTIMVHMHDQDDTDEPSDADLERMDRLASEMEEIDRIHRLKFGRPMGSA